MTEEQESDKKVSGGSGITTSGDVHISVGSGQIGIGNGITQTQIVPPTDLKDLRDSTHHAKIIVTSRTLPILGDGESIIDVIEEKKQELKGLKLNFAVDYMTKNGLENVAREKLEELAKGVDGHPLALKLLVGVVKAFGASDTLEDLSMYQKHKEDTIKKTRRLFDKLAGDEKELLERISVYRRPKSMAAVKMLFTDKTSVDAVEKLIDNSLLETDHKGSYWLHPLVREFAYDDLRNKIEAHKIVSQYYLSLHVPEKRTKKEDVLSLIEAHHHACMAQEYDKAVDIIFDYNLHEDLDRWGSSRTLVDLYQRLLPEDPFNDKPALGSIETHGVVLGNLGLAYSDLGQVEKATEYYEQALAIGKEIKDPRIIDFCERKLKLMEHSDITATGSRWEKLSNIFKGRK